MVSTPASISARLIAFTWVEESPSASRCIEAEGQTIGRPPLPQSCGWVKRNSQSSACTSRGDRPSRGAAALKAASSCPGTATPSGRPVEALSGAVCPEQARRQSSKAGWGAGATLPPAPLGRFP